MTRRPRIALFISVLLLTALACSFPGIAAPQTQPVELATLQAIGTQSALQTAGAESPDATAPPGEPTGEGTIQEGTAPPEQAGPSPTVVHSVFPSSPGSVQGFMTDRSTRALASEGRAIADNFDRLQFERPFTSQAMEYSGWLDITRGEISASSPFFYVTIFLEEGAPADAVPFYGVEIDLDLDGRGDWLIWGQIPAGTEWTTDNVQALRDSNDDVGGSEPVRSDPPQSGNGYDELVFDGGQGADPDAAWIRRSPGSPTNVEVAFKQSLIGSPAEFLWGVWADEGTQDPSWFDYNDQFTISEAGSPDTSTNYYPLQELALLDNSCRWGYGFEPDGTEPGACTIPPTPTPTFTPSPTATPEKPDYTISGRVFRDDNENGSRDSGEPGVAGAELSVRTLSCARSSSTSTTTPSSGQYSFSGLSTGDHCVTLDSWPLGFEPTTSTQRSFDLDGDETANFGLHVIE